VLLRDRGIIIIGPALNHAGRLRQRSFVPQTTLTCPDCGKTGAVTKQAINLSIIPFTVLLMTGLDPEVCEGCRMVLSKNGYTVADAQFHGDRTVTITPTA
jgi:hypothetical protein